MVDKLIDFDREMRGASKLIKKDICGYEGFFCNKCDGIDPNGDECPFFSKKYENLKHENQAE
jgi:hypothetical protein